MVSKKFSVNTCNARHELELLRTLCEKNNWENIELKNSYADMIWLFPLHEEHSNFKS